MNCKKCGNVVDLNSKFCNVCGEAIEGNSQIVNNGIAPAQPAIPVNPAPEQPSVNASPTAPVAPNVNNGEANSVTPNNVTPNVSNNNISNLGVNGSVNQAPMAPQTPPVNNAQVMPNNVNPAMNQNPMAQNQVVQPKKNNSLLIIIIDLAIVAVVIAGLVAVTFAFKFVGNQSSGSSASSSTTTTTTSKRITTTAEPVSAKVSHYGYNFIIPEGFEVFDKKVVEGMYTLQNRQKKTFFCYNLFNGSYSDAPSLVQTEKTIYEEKGATVIANEDEKNGIKYSLLDVTYNNVNCLEYIIDFKGEGIFVVFAYNLDNYGKDKYTDTIIDFVNSAKYETGSFAKGGFSNETKPSVEFDVKLPE